MAVIWIDSPGSSVSVAEPIDFTTDADVVAISVRFTSALVEERAYRDGAFLYPYLGSTQVGHTFSLVRSGGWPARPFEVFVDEQVSAPTDGAEWGAIYTVNLTTQGSLNMTAINAHTIDGYSWYSKGSTPFGGGTQNELFGGLGLRAASGLWGQSGNYSSQSLWFPFGQLPDFNINSPYAAAMRFSGTGLDGSHFVIAGLADLPNTGGAVGTTDRSGQSLIRYEGSPISFTHTAGVSTANPTSITSDSTYGNHLFYAARLHSRVACSAHEIWAGAIDIDAHNLSNGLNAVILSTTLANPGFWFSTNNTGVNVYLTHFAVLQPKVAA
jgi:hypothetical protein